MKTTLLFDERFELLLEGLAYVDAPLEGFLLDRSTGKLFAFRTTEIIEGYLWHWILIPVEDADSVQAAFSRTLTTPPHEWISIVEDARSSPTRHSLSVLRSEIHRIPRRLV